MKQRTEETRPPELKDTDQQPVEPTKTQKKIKDKSDDQDEILGKAYDGRLVRPLFSVFAPLYRADCAGFVAGAGYVR